MILGIGKREGCGLLATFAIALGIWGMIVAAFWLVVEEMGQ